MADNGSERRDRESRWRDQAMAGDRRAWRALYDAAFDGLAAYVQWRCGGLRGWADDVVQETWLVAVRRLGDFRPAEASFLHWLRGIAANVIRNHLRTLKRLPASLDVDVPAASNPGEYVAEQVARALAALPAHYEAVLRAKYFDGLRVDQIAEETASTAKAVESLLGRARTALREAYERRNAERHAVWDPQRQESEP